LNGDPLIIDEEQYLAHYGILRKSGRYPWGSGGTPEERSSAFLSMVREMRDKGLSDTEIAAAFSTDEHKYNTTMLRATNSMAKNIKKGADVAEAERLKAKHMSNVAIGKQMGIGESQVRALLAPGAKNRQDRLTTTAEMLRDEVKSKKIVDVGKGVENTLGVVRNHLDTAIAMLRSEGYELINVQVPQPGTGQKTNTKILAVPGTTYRDVVKDLGQIKPLGVHGNDGGKSFSHILPPLPLSPRRLKINYKEDGGDEADGVIYLRPGKADLSLDGARYAQVRIAVGDKGSGSHYIKGMAMYRDDLPPGVDVVFNTNKARADLGPDKLKALKPLKIDKETGQVSELNPFGSIVSQIGKRDEAGHITKLTSVVNKVNEEGDWQDWSKNLSAHMLSKQRPSWVKERLDTTLSKKKDGLDEILALNNPAIKKKLLEEYADDLDSAAVHLKAAAMPRQATQVILPLNSMKPNEIYAPNFKDGESVVLVRYPHGGIFEIPELTVNNRNKEARRLLPETKDAVGIHHSVAKRLSGADFDGDTVIVIPNNSKRVKNKPPLKELEDFDPQSRYPGYDGMPKLKPERKQRLMGDVSNLITDMTIKGAPDHEIAAAVRHSMVVIDAEKHNLNYKQSAKDNNIASLKRKYQGSAKAGAATLISQAKSPIRVPERRLQKASEGGSVDPKTGKKIYRETGVIYPDKKTGLPTVKKMAVKKLEYVDDAHKLSSGTPVEKLYADHSNRLTKMADDTRLAALRTGKTPQSDSAKRVYADQVSTLNSKLNIALKNAPRERNALIVTDAKIRELKAANPDMDKAELKKLEYLVLSEARRTAGAGKTRIYIDDDEWDAIQAGAISHSKLEEILSNADIARVKELATPRVVPKMSSAKQAKADRLISNGATQAEVAEALGVSLSTLKVYLNGE
jgi:DNA-binding CsgD family transcriptional regulator